MKVIKNYWNLALVISCFAHIVIISGGFNFTLFKKISQKEKVKEIKITVRNDKSILKEKEEKQKASIQEKKSLPPPPYIDNVIKKLMVQNQKKISIDKPQILEKNAAEVVFISDKSLDNILKKNPTYMNYYNSLRAKLHSIARDRYNGRDRGEVSISFILLRDGSLKYVKGYGDNQVLVDLALKIVKESAPFPPFPEDLKDPTCQFGISILFKNK